MYADLESKFNWKQAPIDYEWNSEVSSGISYTMEGNLRLKKALNKMGYKASIGFAAALLNLVLLRFDGHPDLSKEFVDDVNNRIDSIFAAAVDPLYGQILKYGTHSEVPTEGPIHGPCSIALDKIMYVSLEYNFKCHYIHRHLVGLVLLLNHIDPDNKAFNEWLASTIKETASMFPCSYNYENEKISEDDEYDYSSEPPVPREFFLDEDYQYTPETARQKINVFLQSLDYRSNPHLRSPEEMLEAGFAGTPYTL